MRFGWRFLVGLCLAAAVVVGCHQLLNGPGPNTGSEAPPIEGTDLSGKPLTLSEFRGKVVMLEFWQVG